ncbi:phBC6A51 family helix-turn-helix protein [Salsuginibacillus kocurii]|uniref:phBC6A51 family helix-turn-helix protein n=1 Tax=Salsuginibacillus kocurii TaxID=427078 RepID=UPI00035C2BD3|nr:phBC6A51 family helix-turn-helix protein [Salsuginibacillus kocurii]
MENLPDNQQHAATLLATGQMTKKDIAREVGVARQTLHEWIQKGKLEAEVDRLRLEAKTQGENFLIGKVNRAVNEVYDLALNAESEKVRLEALKSILDHAIGRPTNKHEITTNGERKVIIDSDEMQNVFDHIGNTQSTTQPAQASTQHSDDIVEAEYSEAEDETESGDE